MNLYTWLQIAIYLDRAGGARQAAGPVHGQRVRRQAVRARRGSGPGRTIDLSPCRRACDGRNELEGLRRHDAAVQLPGLSGRIRHAAHAAWLPLNPQGFANVTPDSSFNTAVSFATNTNWQGYGGESTMSYLTQMLGLTVQNFVSAAAGLAVLAAMIRGFRSRPRPVAGQEKAGSHGEGLIGNFWVDLTRSTLYILLPLSIVLAVFLVSQGVVQNFAPYQTAQLVQPTKDAEGKDGRPSRRLPLGPAASQIAIKQLGTNGGGFFNVNSAHPYENPTPLANFCRAAWRSS